MQPNPDVIAAVVNHVQAVLDEEGVSAAELARRLAGITPEMYRAYLDYLNRQGYIARRMSGQVAFSTADLVAIAEALNVEPARLMPALANAR